MKTNIKMRVTPEHSKKVQEIISAKNDKYEYIDYQIEFIWIEPDLTVSYSYNESFYVKERSEEVDADLFIRTNGTCEEEPHAELKRKYESGDYIQVYRTICEDSDITEWILPKANIGKFVDKYNGRKYEYKLVHKRHKEVFEYWLNGGDIEVLREDELCLDNPYFWKKCTKNFIESYHERKIYRIKQDQPQTRTFATKKELAEALIRGEKWKDKYGFICYFSEESNNPFFASDGEKGFILDNQQWELCDGKTLWTRVDD